MNDLSAASNEAELLHERLETRMIAQSFPIGILWDPISSGETCIYGSLQGIKRSFFFTHDCQGTTGVVQDRVVIGR